MKYNNHYKQQVKEAYFDDGACVCMYSSVFFTTSCSAIRSFSFRPLAFFSMPCAMTQKQSRWTCSSWVCSKSYLTQRHKPHQSQLILNTWWEMSTAAVSMLCYVMYGVVMFARSNSKVTVTSVLMKHMLCWREKSSVGDRRMSVLMTGRAVTLAISSM